MNELAFQNLLIAEIRVVPAPCRQDERLSGTAP
jgi:hypothetical protein